MLNLMNDLKVLFILQLPPPIHGAALMGSFIKNSILINTSLETRYVNLALSSSAQNIGRGSFRKIYKYVSILGDIIFNLYTFKPGLVYFTPSAKGFGFYKDLFLIFIVKMLRFKVVLHFHNKGVCLKTDFAHKILYRFMLNKTKVILLSNRLYFDISQYADKQDVYICANGIPDENKKLITPDYFSQNSKTLKILFLSNLYRSKGIETLLEALYLLKAKGVCFECYIIGSDGDLLLEDLVKKVVEYNLVAVVKILGEKYGDEKFDLLAKSDILIHPTLDDCFPLVILEALMFGLPVITTKEGAIEDIIRDRHNGFLVDKKNPIAILDALETLVLDKKLGNEMSANARASYVNYFTVDRFQSSLFKILTL